MFTSFKTKHSVINNTGNKYRLLSLHYNKYQQWNALKTTKRQSSQCEQLQTENNAAVRIDWMQNPNVSLQ